MGEEGLEPFPLPLEKPFLPRGAEEAQGLSPHSPQGHPPGPAPPEGGHQGQVKPLFFPQGLLGQVLPPEG